MGERRDDIALATRKETAGQWKALRDRIAARDPSPEALRLAIRRRREASTAFMRGLGEEAIATAEIDRLLRFEDRFNALLERTKR